ncbi:MAG: hypothetical protein VB092_03835 [Oscillospiraceae bacterium]|nr:hypothetical protein [Oscillospiraceae bacterium]
MGCTIDRLTDAELPAFRDFCARNWGARHPLIHDPASFDYYFRRGGGINFLRAQDDETGDILSVAGFLYANSLPAPDVWLSYILTKKGAPLNLGFHMLETLRAVTSCRSFGVNNIRPKTRGLYEFLGYRTGRMEHWYRLNPGRTDYTLCDIYTRNIPAVKNNAVTLTRLDKRGLDDFAFEDYAQYRPYKDRGYVEHRFFENPWLDYDVRAAAENGRTFALAVFRELAHGGHRVLRLVDFIGARERLADCGAAVDRLLRERDADFADVYAYGLPAGRLSAAGFVRREENDANIIPDYLTPPLYENVDFWAVGEDDDDYVLFRADGDQDRPNLTAY